jgi:hypothetical protein
MTAHNITNLPVAPVALPTPRGSALSNPEQFKMNLRAAEYFASSDLVPGHYRNKPANCFIAINRAQRLGVDEFYFLEKTFVIGGRLGIAAELAIELANSSGRFRGPIRFALHGEGDKRACTASAVLVSGEAVENTVSYAMAKADGWTKNSKWQSIPDQMLQYRAGVFLARLYAGGAMGGMQTRDELEDIAAATMRDVTPPKVEPPPPSPKLPKPAIRVKVPGQASAEFSQDDGLEAALKGALDFMSSGILDGRTDVVEANDALLNRIAERLPEMADAVAELRAAAVMALDMTPPEPESDGFVQRFVAGDDDVFPGDLPNKS